MKVTVRGSVPEVGLALKPAVGAVDGEVMVALASFENPLWINPPME